jgi:hypothetical protein
MASVKKLIKAYVKAQAEYEGYGSIYGVKDNEFIFNETLRSLQNAAFDKHEELIDKLDALATEKAIRDHQVKHGNNKS